jgi:capsular polysaccharide biosynthesis protein
MDLGMYLAVLRRRWLVVLAATLVGLITAAAVIPFSAQRYESTARAVFGAQNAGTGQDMAYAGGYVQSRMQTYKGLATTPTVLDPVIDDLGLDTTAARLADQITVATSQIDTLIDITVSDVHARQAARIADTVVAELITAVDRLENPPASQTDAARVHGVVAADATVATSPSSPRIPFMLLVGLLLGLFVGLSGVLLEHALRTPEQA